MRMEIRSLIKYATCYFLCYCWCVLLHFASPTKTQHKCSSGDDKKCQDSESTPSEQNSSGYRILVFSAAISRSHLISNARIADALAEAGHNVTLLEVEWFERAPFPKFSTKIVTRLAVGGLLEPSKEVGDEMEAEDSWVANAPFEWTQDWPLIRVFFSVRRYRQFNIFNDALCARILDSQQELLHKLREAHFDIYFGEQLTLCGSALSHWLGIPTHFWVSSTPMLEYMGWLTGVPAAPSYVPVALESTVASDQLGYWGRVNSLGEYLGMLWVYLRGIQQTTQLYRQRFGEDFPHLAEIVGSSPLVFVNTHELVDFPRPTLHKVVHIGGLGMSVQAKKHDSEDGSHSTTLLSKAFANEYRKGRLGVVYCSFGTIVKLRRLPPGFITNLLQAFAQFSPDYHFIFKVDNISWTLEQDHNQSISKSNNIHLAEWVPQAELLASGRVRAFITHGGYNSLMEAALNGVPLVGMGFFADQLRNVRLAERNGWGVAVDQRQLLGQGGAAQLAATLRRVLHEPSAGRYRRGAERVRRLLASAPMSAAQRLVAWVELVAGAGGGHLPELHPAGGQLSLAAYYNVDILVPAGLLSAGVVLMGVFWLAQAVGHIVGAGVLRRLRRWRSPKAKRAGGGGEDGKKPKRKRNGRGEKSD